MVPVHACIEAKPPASSAKTAATRTWAAAWKVGRGRVAAAASITQPLTRKAMPHSATRGARAA